MPIIDDIGLKLVQLLPPETAHSATIAALKAGVVRKMAPLSSETLEVLRTDMPVSGLCLPSVLGVAAGFDKNCEVAAPTLRMGFGFVECGTVTPLPQAGNPKPRLFRLKEDLGVINRMGFNNAGLDAFVSRLKTHADLDLVVGANVGANKTSQGEKRIADYVEGIEAVWPYCSYLTLNISSPNTPGLRGLQDKGELTALLGAASKAISRMQDVHNVKKPVFLKIAPDIDDEAINDIVSAVVQADGMTGLIVSNTTISRPDNLMSESASQMGGLSGKPVFELSTHVLRKVARVSDGRLDIIGAGGVYDAQSAYAKIRAGAHAVQLYSALVYGGAAMVPQILNGLAKLLEADGFANIGEAVGADL
ncbi:quinone-dependent dihydroorotate dehydrogenase [Hirschia litorea]|uniref:Dihydroorotate dehydrogenase (quinone) n=1 Tax=Hirschia litorea TaxID=1199156 RepID=A0ABW2IJL6_9PROT